MSNLTVNSAGALSVANFGFIKAGFVLTGFFDAADLGDSPATVCVLVDERVDFVPSAGDFVVVFALSAVFEADVDFDDDALDFALSADV